KPRIGDVKVGRSLECLDPHRPDRRGVCARSQSDAALFTHASSRTSVQIIASETSEPADNRAKTFTRIGLHRVGRPDNKVRAPGTDHLQQNPRMDPLESGPRVDQSCRWTTGASPAL